MISRTALSRQCCPSCSRSVRLRPALSALQIQVPGVFYWVQKALLHPTALFDQEAQSPKPCYVRALKWIFILCDHDRDGALSDTELNEFQVRCFSAPLQPAVIFQAWSEFSREDA